MKKKHVLFGAVAVLALSLTSCQYIIDFFNSDGEGGISWNPFSPSSSSYSKQPISDVSTPPAGSLEANRASYRYEHFVENNVYPLSCTPSIGTAKLLIIPVWFSDSTTFIDSGKRETVRSDIEKAYFGSQSDTGWHSVKSYYEKESLGALTLTGTVSQWYECGKKYSNYATETATEESSVPKTAELSNISCTN